MKQANLSKTVKHGLFYSLCSIGNENQLTFQWLEKSENFRKTLSFPPEVKKEEISNIIIGQNEVILLSKLDGSLLFFDYNLCSSSTLSPCLTTSPISPLSKLLSSKKPLSLFKSSQGIFLTFKKGFYYFHSTHDSPLYVPWKSVGLSRSLSPCCFVFANYSEEPKLYMATLQGFVIEFCIDESFLLQNFATLRSLLLSKRAGNKPSPNAQEAPKHGTESLLGKLCSSRELDTDLSSIDKFDFLDGFGVSPSLLVVCCENEVKVFEADGLELKNSAKFFDKKEEAEISDEKFFDLGSDAEKNKQEPAKVVEVVRVMERGCLLVGLENGQKEAVWLEE